MAVKKPKETYTRNAAVVFVHDGDTVGLVLDLGYNVHIEVSCRLNGIDAPELNTAAGKTAAAALEELLPAGTEVVTQTIKGNENDKFGRYLADIYLPKMGKSVNQWMIDQGLAKAYDGGKRS